MTLELVHGCEAQLGDWMTAKIPHARGSEGWGKFVTIGILREEEGQRRLVGCALFNDYHPEYGHIQVSFATEGPGWASRGIIRSILAYPFVQLKCYTVRAITPAKGEAEKVKILPRLGFVREGAARHFFGKGRHGTAYSMTADEYRAKWR